MASGSELDRQTYETLDRLTDGDADERVRALREAAPEEAPLETQTTVFQALANEARLRILAALRDRERCVCELQAALDAPQSTVATHLTSLREAGLVRARRKGRWRYYRIADSAALDLVDLAASVEVPG
jgi:ArsR family transcriptional regulator